MGDYFPKPKSLGKNATKADLKNATGIDTSDFFKKTDLGNLKCNVDKLDIHKFKNAPSGLSNLHQVPS